MSPISSLYSKLTNQEDEITECICDKLEVILIEKLISLLRRTAEAKRGHSKKDDETLVRHVFDLFFIVKNGFDKNLVKENFARIVEYDKQQFGNRHAEFANSPYDELKFGLQQLDKDKVHEQRYQKFLSPMVYNLNPPPWEQGIKNIKHLFKEFIEK